MLKKVFEAKWLLIYMIIASSVLFYGINAYSYDLNKGKNFLDKGQTNQQILEVKLVNGNKLGVDSLMIIAVVIKQMEDENASVVRIISGTYRNRLMIIKGDINAKKGEYIRGFMNKNQFSLVGKGGQK